MALTPATTLVSLTAFRALDYEFFADSDSTELDLVTDAPTRPSTSAVSGNHDLAPAAPPDLGRGMFLFSESDHQTFWVDQPAGPFQRRLDPRVDAASRAVFGQATVGLTSRLSATAGVRYTHEGKDIDNAGGRYALEDPNPPISGSVYSYSDSIAHDAWTPKVGVEMKLPHGALAYVSATRGFKSGGFNLSSTAPGRGYAPEWAWSYEGGLKGTLMGGRSRISTSAFVMDYTNLQVQTPIGIGVLRYPQCRRGDDSRRRSGEHVTDRARHRSRRPRRPGSTPPTIATSRSQSIASTGDVSGNRLNNAPEWAGRLWIEWTGDIGRSRRLSLSAESTAQSTVFFTPFNDSIQRQSPYGLLGARVEYGPGHRRWTVAAYARNLTNTDYVTATFGTPPNAYAGRPGPSRQFAVEFTVRR